MAAYVLVHGAFQGGWVWQCVAAALRSQGHQVYTPTLTGCGERVHLLRQDVDLPTYIEDVANVFEFEGLHEATLVAHSYAGLVCSAVARKRPHRIANLVDVDALIPEPNKSFVDLAPDAFRHLLETHTHAKWLVRPWPIHQFGIADERERSWFQSRLVNFPLAAFTTPFPGTFDGTLQVISYIHCPEGANPLIDRMANEAKAKGWAYYELHSGHCPMVTVPKQLAELLIQVQTENISNESDLGLQDAKANSA